MPISTPSTAATGSLFSVNATLAKELCVASEKIAALLAHPGGIQATDIMRFPGVLETKEADLSSLQDEVISLLDKTLKDLAAARGREGERDREQVGRPQRLLEVVEFDDRGAGRHSAHPNGYLPQH